MSTRLVAGIILFASSLPSAAVAQDQDPVKPDAPKFRVYLGTYTGTTSKGIYTLEFDSATGALVPKGLVAETSNPSYLAVHPSNKFLYAVNEVGSYQGKPTGSVTGFSLDGATGALQPINMQPSAGGDPCYITIHPSGSAALVANYSGGTVAALPIAIDGRLAPPSSVIKHSGSSVNKDRQGAPHAHSINFDPSFRRAVAADLGLDQLLIDRFDPATKTLTPNTPAYADVKPGSGPRHFAFHPDGRHAYAINELNSTVTVFDYDPNRGALSTLQTVSTRPDGATGTNYPADIKVHPTGNFVFGSNRGDDTIAVFSVNRLNGQLTPVGHQAINGKTPRNFAIDPTGNYLIAAGQNSDTLTVFKLDLASGKLTQVGQPVAMPKPVCVVFVPMGG
jgi:6-phosphogluconolactonase